VLTSLKVSIYLTKFAVKCLVLGDTNNCHAINMFMCLAMFRNLIFGKMVHKLEQYL